LPRADAAGGLQFVFQASIFALESRAFLLNARTLSFGPLQFLTQPRELAPECFDLIGGRLLRAPAHALVMPEFPSQYKSDAVTKYHPC
jgi:hypothetical protein